MSTRGASDRLAPLREGQWRLGAPRRGGMIGSPRAIRDYGALGRLRGGPQGRAGSAEGLGLGDAATRVLVRRGWGRAASRPGGRTACKWTDARPPHRPATPRAVLVSPSPPAKGEPGCCLPSGGGGESVEIDFLHSPC